MKVDHRFLNEDFNNPKWDVSNVINMRCMFYGAEP